MVTSVAGVLNAGTPSGAADIVGMRVEGATGYESTLVADLASATAATINQIRLAFQTQRMLERDARGGSRYVEQLLSHFGVRAPDYRLQRPEYLGGSKIPITVNPIAQTAAYDAEPSPTTPSALGNLGAEMHASGHKRTFTYSATEHGYIIGLACVRATPTYQQGTRRHWRRLTAGLLLPRVQPPRRTSRGNTRNLPTTHKRPCRTHVGIPGTPRRVPLHTQRDHGPPAQHRRAAARLVALRRRIRERTRTQRGVHHRQNQRNPRTLTGPQHPLSNGAPKSSWTSSTTTRSPGSCRPTPYPASSTTSKDKPHVASRTHHRRRSTDQRRHGQLRPSSSQPHQRATATRATSLGRKMSTRPTPGPSRTSKTPD